MIDAPSEHAEPATPVHVFVIWSFAVGVDDREYMRESEEVVPDSVRAANQDEAEKLLKFSCPTQAADGTWHRTTVAVSNVPVIELCNILSNASFVARRLHEIANVVGGVNGEFIMREAIKIEGLHLLLRQRDEGGPVVSQADIDQLFAGANIHAGDSK